MDELERIKRKTYLLHQGEDGVWDILIGFFFLFAGLSLASEITALPVIFIAFAPMFVRGLKKRYVYPRIGVAVFEPAPVKKTTLKVILLTLACAMAAASMVVILLHKVSLIHSLSWLLGLLAGVSVVLGGLLRERRMYIAALVLGIIGASLQMFIGLWLGIALLIPIIILFIGLLVWSVKNGNLRRTREIFERPSVVLHGFFVVFGILVVCFCLFGLIAPHRGQVALNWVGDHFHFLFGTAATVVSVCMGIAYLKPRFYVYAVVIFAFVALPGIVNALMPFRHKLFPAAGLIILFSGALFLWRFVRKYPVLEGEDE